MLRGVWSLKGPIFQSRAENHNISSLGNSIHLHFVSGFDRPTSLLAFAMDNWLSFSRHRRIVKKLHIWNGILSWMCFCIASEAILFSSMLKKVSYIRHFASAPLYTDSKARRLSCTALLPIFHLLKRPGKRAETGPPPSQERGRETDRRTLQIDRQPKIHRTSTWPTRVDTLETLCAV